MLKILFRSWAFHRPLCHSCLSKRYPTDQSRRPELLFPRRGTLDLLWRVHVHKLSAGVRNSWGAEEIVLCALVPAKGTNCEPCNWFMFYSNSFIFSTRSQTQQPAILGQHVSSANRWAWSRSSSLNFCLLTSNENKNMCYCFTGREMPVTSAVIVYPTASWRLTLQSTQLFSSGC